MDYARIKMRRIVNLKKRNENLQEEWYSGKMGGNGYEK